MRYNTNICLVQLAVFGTIFAIWTLSGQIREAVLLGMIFAIIAAIAIAVVEFDRRPGQELLLFDLGLANATGLVVVLYVVIEFGILGHIQFTTASVSASAGVFAVCCAVVATLLSRSAARVVREHGTFEPLWLLRLIAAPVGIGPIFGRIAWKRFLAHATEMPT